MMRARCKRFILRNASDTLRSVPCWSTCKRLLRSFIRPPSVVKISTSSSWESTRPDPPAPWLAGRVMYAGRRSASRRRYLRISMRGTSGISKDVELLCSRLQKAFSPSRVAERQVVG
jgi:hypothetical protein